MQRQASSGTAIVEYAIAGAFLVVIGVAGVSLLLPKAVKKGFENSVNANGTTIQALGGEETGRTETGGCLGLCGNPNNGGGTTPVKSDLGS